MVRCCRCKVFKNETEFGKDKNRHNGLTSYCKPCSSAYDKEAYRKNREYRIGTMRAYRKDVKTKVFDAYGRSCKCCGETEELFLDIDHMDNDGAEHRKEHKLNCGTQFYAWLINNNFPSNFQTLCCNCNRGKFRNGGICPHQLSPQG
jgi:hypothetical protein